MKKTTLALAVCAAVISSGVMMYAYSAATDATAPALPTAPGAPGVPPTPEDKNPTTMPKPSGNDVSPSTNDGNDAQATPKNGIENNSGGPQMVPPAPDMGNDPQVPSDTTTPTPSDDNGAPISGATSAPNDATTPSNDATEGAQQDSGIVE